jgi:hypothetical protein
MTMTLQKNTIPRRFAQCCLHSPGFTIVLFDINEDVEDLLRKLKSGQEAAREEEVSKYKR